MMISPYRPSKSPGDTPECAFSEIKHPSPLLYRQSERHFGVDSCVENMKDRQEYTILFLKTMEINTKKA